MTIQHDEYLAIKRILPALALLSFFVYKVTNIKAFSVVGLTVLMAMVLVLDKNQLYTSYAFLLPNTFIFKFQNTETAIIGYVLVLIVLKRLFEKHFKTNITKNVFAFLLVHVSIVIASVFLNGETSLIGKLIRLICFVFVAGDILHLDKARYELAKFYVLGNTVNVVLGILFNIIVGAETFGYFAGIGNDRNYFSITLAFAIGILTVSSYKKNNISIGDIIQFFILLIGGILSGSRTFVICFLPTMVVGFCALKRWNTPFYRKLAISFFAIIVAIVLYGVLKNNILNVYNRFQSSSAAGGNGRFDLWDYYIKRTFSSAGTALLGCGLSTNKLGIGNVGSVEHNTWVQMLYTIGILGATSLVVLFFGIYSNFTRGVKNRVAMYMPLCSILIGYSTINGLYSDNLMFALILSFCILGDKSGRKSTNNTQYGSCCNEI